MRMLLAYAVIFAQVTPGFVDAHVDGVEVGPDAIEIELTVHTDPGGVVVAHLVDPGGVQSTVSLTERSSGLYGAVTEVPRVDFVVVFEAVAVDGYQSDPWRLTELGLDRALLGSGPGAVTTAGDPELLDEETRDWGWLGLAAAALSLSALAFWALGGDESGGRRREEERPDSESI